MYKLYVVMLLMIISCIIGYVAVFLMLISGSTFLLNSIIQITMVNLMIIFRMFLRTIDKLIESGELKR